MAKERIREVQPSGQTSSLERTKRPCSRPAHSQAALSLLDQPEYLRKAAILGRSRSAVEVPEALSISGVFGGNLFSATRGSSCATL